ncbi:MAG TPA: hypothetical protein GXX63_12200 [Tissierellia bacterium]|nr:hypothetical protein [Tissierellia bacterium]
MDKQKIAELAKRLDEMIKPRESADINVGIDVFKGPEWQRTGVTVSIFTGPREAPEMIVRVYHMDKSEIIDGVRFRYQYYEVIGRGFEFHHMDDSDTVYSAKKYRDRYRVTWGKGGGWTDYTRNEVEELIGRGNWRVI